MTLSMQDEIAHRIRAVMADAIREANPALIDAATHASGLDEIIADLACTHAGDLARIAILAELHGYSETYRADLPGDDGALCICGGIRRYHGGPVINGGNGCDDCPCPAFVEVT